MDVRRTFGTAAGAAGVPRRLLRGMMGHADEATTGVYTRYVDADARVARERLARHLRATSRTRMARIGRPHGHFDLRFARAGSAYGIRTRGLRLERAVS